MRSKRLTVGQAGEQERLFLRPLPAFDYECCQRTTARLTPYSQVVFETNRYSVPVRRARREVTVKASPFQVEIWDRDQVNGVSWRSKRRGAAKQQLDNLSSLTFEGGGPADEALRSGEQRRAAVVVACGWLRGGSHSAYSYPHADCSLSQRDARSPDALAATATAPAGARSRRGVRCRSWQTGHSRARSRTGEWADLSGRLWHSREHKHLQWRGGWRVVLSNTLWAAPPNFHGLFLLRGRQIDGAGEVRFSLGISATPDLQATFSTEQAGSTPSGWLPWMNYVRVRAPGCYAVQVDGLNFSEIITFHVMDTPQQ